MTTSSLFLFFVAALITTACTASASPITNPEDSTCPRTTVANINDPYVQYFGSWALGHTTLAFEKVESAKVQVANDDCSNNINCNYELIVDATQRPGGEVHKYKAVVYEEDSTAIKLLSLGSVVGHPLWPTEGMPPWIINM